MLHQLQQYSVQAAASENLDSSTVTSVDATVATTATSDVATTDSVADNDAVDEIDLSPSEEEKEAGKRSSSIGNNKNESRNSKNSSNNSRNSTGDVVNEISVCPVKQRGEDVAGAGVGAETTPESAPVDKLVSLDGEHAGGSGVSVPVTAAP